MMLNYLTVMIPYLATLSRVRLAERSLAPATLAGARDHTAALG